MHCLSKPCANYFERYIGSNQFVKNTGATTIATSTSGTSATTVGPLVAPICFKPKNRVIAFIPLRAGSKGVPNKNTRYFFGKPLFRWVYDAAFKCPEIDEIVIATDDQKVIDELKYATGSFKKTEIYRRSAESASDTATTESVVREWMINHKSEMKSDTVICLIQATSPFTKPEHLTAAI
jgi:CMP-N-acetylneuraminic acid synthetase